MVEFDGIELSSIDSAIRVIDVVVGPPSMRPTTISPALTDGDVYAGTKIGPRDVTITFVIMESDEIRRTDIFERVIRWAKISSGEQQLTVQQEPDGYLMAVCTQLPQNNAREYWTPLTIVFTAYNPYFQAFEESSAPMNTDFVVTHAERPDWRIEQDIPSLIAFPTWRNGDELSFSTLLPGKLTLDRKTQTAFIGGSSTLPSLLLGSRFFNLSAGKNNIIATNGAGGTIYWRERWL